MAGLIGRLLTCSLGTWLIFAILRAIFHDDAKHWPLTIVCASVLWSVSLAKYVIGAMSALKHAARRQALEHLNGRHYTFDNQPVRLFLVDEVIWVAVRDVAAILAPPPDERELRHLGGDYGTIPGVQEPGYTEAGLLRLLTTRCASRRATHDVIRFKHWLEKETFPNVRRLPASASRTPRL